MGFYLLSYHWAVWGSWEIWADWQIYHPFSRRILLLCIHSNHCWSQCWFFWAVQIGTWMSHHKTTNLPQLCTIRPVLLWLASSYHTCLVTLPIHHQIWGRNSPLLSIEFFASSHDCIFQQQKYSQHIIHGPPSGFYVQLKVQFFTHQLFCFFKKAPWTHLL